MIAAMTHPISVPSLRRLPLYLRLLEGWRAEGRTQISCTHLADALGFDPTQVRKDLAAAGASGRPKVGYDLQNLRDCLAGFLGWDNPGEAFLVGAGSLGQALLAYEGFAARGMSIVAVFDPDPGRVGGNVCGKPVLPMVKLANLTARMHVRLGVLAVPADTAPAVGKAMADAGLQGIWNFAPVRLDLGPLVVVEHVDLAQSLAVLSHRLTELPHPSEIT
jgi:redox-sensing transcriptional repressor